MHMPENTISWPDWFILTMLAARHQAPLVAPSSHLEWML